MLIFPGRHDIRWTNKTYGAYDDTCTPAERKRRRKAGKRAKAARRNNR